MAEQKAAFVIDNGSSLSKVGFAGHNAPSVVFPTVVGRLRQKGVEGHIKPKGEVLVGDEAIKKRGKLTLRSPIQQGVISDWADMEEIWKYAFEKELSASPKECPLLLTEAPLNPKNNREKITQIMFEDFNVPALYVASQAVMSLYASGLSTGIVLDSGDSVTHIVPIYQGRAIQDVAHHVNLGGRDLTDHLLNSLLKSGYSLTTFAEREYVRHLKETVCYVAANYDLEHVKALQGDLDKKYELPDGQTVIVGTQRIDCPEILFKPTLFDRKFDGISQTTYDCINQCEEKIQKDLYGRVVLSGGNTMFEGIAQRMGSEIKLLAPSMSVKIIAPPERRYSAWIGGSIFASLSTFGEMCISAQEYNEAGPGIVHRKCVV